MYANGLKLTENGKLKLKQTNSCWSASEPITLDWSQVWVHGQEYTFRVSTLSGSNFDMKYTAP